MREIARTPGADARERWNARHAEHAEDPLAAPSGWLVEHRELLAARVPGRALDVAAGRGRNSLFLAELGFDVDALDVSDVSVESIARYARERSVTVRARRVDVSEPFPRPPYRVIVTTSFLDRSLFGRMSEALAPGGLLVYETFTRDHVERAGGSMPLERTLERGELREAFAALEVIDYREAIVPREMGPGLRGVASLVARRVM
jgi:SAM-dependent methyltransferase